MGVPSTEAEEAAASSLKSHAYLYFLY